MASVKTPGRFDQGATGVSFTSGQVAVWWERKTGEPIHDLAPVSSKRGELVVLVHEVNQ